MESKCALSDIHFFYDANNFALNILALTNIYKNWKMSS